MRLHRKQTLRRLSKAKAGVINDSEEVYQMEINQKAFEVTMTRMTRNISDDTAPGGRKWTEQFIKNYEGAKPPEREAAQPVGLPINRALLVGAIYHDIEAECSGNCARAANSVMHTISPFLAAREREAAQPVDWAEDAAHENGNYQCRCLNCNRSFVGHKRRLICKDCSVPSDCRKAFDQWLDNDASSTVTARSKYYTAQEQVLGWLAFQAAWHMRTPERESGIDREVLTEFMNAYNWASRTNNYYSARAEEIILENGGIVVVNQRRGTDNA